MILDVKKIKFGICCLMATLVFASSGTANAQSDALRWQLKEGQRFDMVTTQKINTSIDAGFGKMEIPMTMIVDMEWLVEEAKGEEFRIEQRITRMRMEMTLPMGQGEMSVDTKEEGSGGMDGMMGMPDFKAMIDVPFHMTMNSQGKVTSFEVPDELNMGGQGGPGFSPQSMKQMAALTSFPDKPVSKGDSWESNDSFEMEGMGEMKMENKFTYEGTESVDGKEVSKIDVNTNMTLEADGGGEFQMAIDNAEFKGKMFFDNVAGHLVKITGKQKMEGGMDAGGQNMSMTMTMEQETVMKLKK